MNPSPALPLDEWKRLEVEGEARLGHGLVIGVLPVGGPIRIWGSAVRGTVEIPREALPGLIAVALHVLPDDDLRKPTRGLLAQLTTCLAYLAPLKLVGVGSEQLKIEEAFGIRRLRVWANHLALLLPPNDEEDGVDADS